MTVQQAFLQLASQLTGYYDEREAKEISHMIIEAITGYSKAERLLHKEEVLTAQQEEKFSICSKELLEQKPVQYVLGKTWFAGMEFKVNEAVLIPRPETEELTEWIISEHKENEQVLSIIDIGTGSGCIAVSLKRMLPQNNISAIDVSETALQIAKKNAHRNNATVDFHLTNFLEENDRKKLGKFNIIVSNPPYIKYREKNDMRQHVVNYEPHQALFVTDDDPLIFYRNIALFSKEHLLANGEIYLELNEMLGKETEALFQSFSFNTVLKKDMQGKDRMLKAFK
ncbi:MAG: peptide chain release factor N(5)-glutamine methyltransferase [Bacteroidota bacterium]|nr:peptide chain release factor N(5)-glutamine methyltransferase [Bacteroidota bacterium]